MTIPDSQGAGIPASSPADSLEANTCGHWMRRVGFATNTLLVRLSDAQVAIARLERERDEAKRQMGVACVEQLRLQGLLKAARPDTAAIMALADAMASAKGSFGVTLAKAELDTFNVAREALRRALDGKG